MILSHIVAVSRNYVIGRNNKLPWRMPDDTQYFHKITAGHIVIMGRKNYEANKGALKNRSNIVISRNPGFRPKDAEVTSSVDEALALAKSYAPEEVFIVGGGEIYKITLPLVNRIYITIIDTFVEGDTFYPRINFKDYKIISEIERKADSRNPFPHTYYILEKPY